MTSSSWNQFINQFLLEFGRIDWKVDLSMLPSTEKTNTNEKSENHKPPEAGKSAAVFVCWKLTSEVRIKGFILTPYSQDGFFRQTKCKLRVPNITNYCSSCKALSSLT